MNASTRRPRRPAGTRNLAVRTDVDGAFSSALEDLTDLKQEMEDWQQNLECNNMEHLPKYEEVTECYDALDNGVGTLEGLTVPEVLSGYVANYTTDTRQSAQSRSGRLNNALSALKAAELACEEWLYENPELTLFEGEGEPSEDQAAEQSDVNEREAEREEVEEFRDELDNAASELECVSFPGMY